MDAQRMGAPPACNAVETRHSASGGMERLLQMTLTATLYVVQAFKRRYPRKDAWHPDRGQNMLSTALTWFSKIAILLVQGCMRTHVVQVYGYETHTHAHFGFRLLSLCASSSECGAWGHEGFVVGSKGVVDAMTK